VRVLVAYLGPEGAETLAALDVAPGTTVADAVALSRVVERIGVPPGSVAFAIFGRRVTGDTALADDDRIEVTRPLQRDPALARRRRAAAQAGQAKRPGRTGRGDA
jgi:putative ubiquitin-RnfH superfamily antitoxin RatB of RatAB toxin-antitoxin module